ncbi:sensor histidine kinase [Acetobacterium bakii]|uniref:histidine kinase n=1 Tax=Acetobacterium bakii TaxID=52689 RepID=A0A0L6U1N2_9FIRM|nr:HAMP domain-containing sensor histidine kinase [Acetobacterium bakii]KNZ42262.1 hypothetical protein AKG39_07735 [Acetobacterium bakii]
MKQLKKSIIRYFILFALLLSLAKSLLDGGFDWIMEGITDEAVAVSAILVYLLISILCFLLISIWYTWIINKKILAETNRQLNERNMLYANIVHDLKTPMTLIMGFSQALKEGRITDADKEDTVETIYNKTKKANELLDLLFQYTKLSTDEYQMYLEKTDICRLVRESVAMNYEVFEEKQLKIEIDIPDYPMIREVDHLELARAINNLLINAHQHNRNGSRVLVKIIEMGQKIKIVVADNGEAIDQELAVRIFEPFICADESRNSKDGSGLGLAIAKKIVEKHQGRLFIDDGISGYTKGFIIEF